MLLFYVISSAAQTKSKSESVGDSKRLVGVYHPLTKDETYKTISPEKLKYWDISKTYGTSLPYLSVFSDAKKAKEDPADYTFTLITPGIQNEEYSSPVVFQPNKGKVVEFTYSFPCSLQVTDKNGNVIKTFVLNNGDAELTCLVHPGFLLDAESFKNPLKLPTSGFNQTDEKIIEWIEKNKEAVYSRIEFNMLWSNRSVAQHILKDAYDNPKLMYKPYIMTIGNKKEKETFKELNDKIESFAIEVSNAFLKPIDNDLQNKLLEYAEYFASNYNPEASKDAKQIYTFNASMAYLLGGETEKAYQQYLVADQFLGTISAAASVFEEMYPELYYINYLKKNENNDIVFITPAVKVRERIDHKKREEALAKQQEKDADYQAEMQKLLANNIDKQEGRVILKNGGEVSGLISIKFVEVNSSNNIANLDLGKIVYVNSKPYHPKDVDHVIVGERRFAPVTIDESAVIQVIGFVSSGYGGACFMEIIHQNGNCIGYVDPSITIAKSFYVAKNKDEKVKSFSSILRGKKAAKNFLENCTSLLEKVISKEFENNNESLNSFIDQLQSCSE